MNMKKISLLLLTISSTLLISCKKGNGDFDASGTFEANEVIVAAETAGKILDFAADEGTKLEKNQVAVVIDPTNLQLQSEQVEASINALGEKTSDLTPYIRTLEQQIEIQKTQVSSLERERTRFANLLKEDAATGKQLDDIETQLKVAKEQLGLSQRQLDQQKAAISTQNRSVLSEQTPLSKKKAQIDDQLSRTKVMNPVAGTVLTSYAEAGEITAPGKALYKIADLSIMDLRAYISGDQFSQVKIGQSVKVFIDNGKDDYKELQGTVTWISDKAEFTPKTIQTKDERAHLVYATKIRVKNDGSVKVGMYGEVKF
jgi:HlyD family secretion protein